MYVSLRSAIKGAAVVTGAFVALATNTALAQTVTTVNGVDIDNQVFDSYLQNRLQKPLARQRPRSPKKQHRHPVMRRLPETNRPR